ncbi:MAG: J domain-containing protein [Cytophagales bacterium]|nr:J domain-containing protein [Cytophagales bacterium]
MKNYYFILGLNLYASEAEIKQAYRKLALQFHPDKNASKEAAAIFIEVNEAYEVLGDAVRKREYDKLLLGAPSEPVVVHRDPRYRPKPPGQGQSGSRRRQALEAMRDYLKYAIMLSRLALLFSAVLIADYTLPSKKTREEIVSIKNPREVRRDGAYKLSLQDGEVINLRSESAVEFERGAAITLYSSAWFSVPLVIENERTQFKAQILGSIYGNFIFLPIVLLLTSLLGTFWWKGIEFRFNLGVVNGLLMLLSFIFLRIHNF